MDRRLPSLGGRRIVCAAVRSRGRDSDGFGLMRKTSNRRPTVSVTTYREDPLYPRIARTVATILQRGTVVAPVDVLVGMGLLASDHLEAWRRGRVPALEQVINCNLTRLSRLLRILRLHAHDLNLVPSVTVYRRWGKGPKQALRFTRSGDPKLEVAYARHFVWPGKVPLELATAQPELGVTMEPVVDRARRPWQDSAS